MPRLIRWSFLAVTLAGPVFAASISAPPDFSRDVRPILADNCFKCHGPDEGSREGGLRLDQREAALKGGKSGLAAISPGKPAESELLARINETDPDELMPPRDANKTLTPAQKETLRRWIAAGAEYREHWAFVAPVRPAVPGEKTASPRLSASNPIDAFVRAKLAEEKLTASPPADAATLSRRLHLDLVGLPPLPHEVDAFAAAYARAPDAAVTTLVDRLLASPHYGEKWGRHWLDAARYADSDGYEKDKRRTVWLYRDYVISALNRDLPYDRFLLEQLAGDLLPNPTPEQITATGFLRLSMLNEEGAIDPEQFRMDAMFDRMDVLGKGVLGLTLACAQCHTHKYDPITHEEYYRFFAFLNNDHEAMPAMYSPEQRRTIAGLQRELEQLENEMRAKRPLWRDELACWEAELRASQGEWETLTLENVGDNAQRYEKLADGSLLAAGWAPGAFTARFKSAASALRKITAFRIELMTHPDLPAGGPGRSYKGTFALTEFEVRTDEPEPAETKKKLGPALKFASATADVDTPRADLEERFRRSNAPGAMIGPAALAIDGDAKTAWGSELGPGLRNADRAAIFTLKEPLVLTADDRLFIRLAQTHGGGSDDFATQALGRFRIQITDAEKTPAPVLANQVREALAIAPARRTPEQQTAIFRAWAATVSDWKEENKKLAAIWQRWPEYTTTYALQRRAQPRVTSVLDRGNWLKPLRAVAAGTPAFLHALPRERDGSRLELARWLTDAKSPVTARVFVNRVWQQYFGTGLVATAEDFGLQGDAPSHPALLDWLACELMQPSTPGVATWSIKHLHRLIATSATYRQSSRVTPELLARDPDNRLLARGPRFRVEGEIVRDIALAASGLLNAKIGGPSVMPPAPADLFKPPASYAPFPWREETGTEKYRRALYTFRRRSTPYPMLQVFDTPNGETACVRRLRSNTPLQALTLLNEPIFMDTAIALARRTLEDAGPDDAARVTYAFRRVVSRAPDRDEHAALLGLLHQQRRRHAAGELDPAEMFSPEQPPPLGATLADWAAFTVVARTILNLDEAITKE